ncbi:hypothetical protein CARUB_v10007764mg, partial [Capsella rubella]
MSQSTNHDLSFSSLPHEIVVSCLARVSGLCLVSKQFRSIILSNEIYKARSHLGTKETRLYVWLKLPSCCYPTLPLHSSYNYQELIPSVIVGSETYIIGGYTLRKAPSMSVARTNAVIVALYPKIYVMGGCSSDESMNWAEGFDLMSNSLLQRTRVRNSLIKHLKMIHEKRHLGHVK